MSESPAKEDAKDVEQSSATIEDNEDAARPQDTSVEAALTVAPPKEAPPSKPLDSKIGLVTPKHSPALSGFSKKSSELTPRQDNRNQSSSSLFLASDHYLPEPTTKPREPPVVVHDDGDDHDDAATVNISAAPRSPSKCPLFCCFYAEFDLKTGPVVRYQSPAGFMDQEIDISLHQVHEILAETFAALGFSQQHEQHSYGSNSNGADSHKTSTSTDPTAAAFTNTQADAASSKVDGVPASTTTSDKKNNNNVGDDQDDNTAVDSEGGSFSIFDSCSEYIITGNELSGNIVNLSTHHFHVLTRPTIIADERFERNSLFFCIGLVLRRSEDPRPFRPILSKWALTLRDMELESHFLSNQATRPGIQTFLQETLVSLNSDQWEINLPLDDSNILNLKLFHPPKLPALAVPDYAVPVLLRRDWQVQMYDWDLSINWVLMHIDGVTTARQISIKAEVDMEMVRACLRVLRHHGLVALADMFFFSNRYEATDKAAAMLAGNESRLLLGAVDFVVKRTTSGSGGGSSSHTGGVGGGAHQESGSPQLFGMSPEQRGSLEQHVATFSSSYREHREAQAIRLASLSSNHSTEIPSPRRSDYAEIKSAVAELYCCCNRSRSIGDVWKSLVAGQTLSGTRTTIKWKKIFKLVDHRRFAMFGLVHGLLRRVHNFPLLVDDVTCTSTGTAAQDGTAKSLLEEVQPLEAPGKYQYERSKAANNSRTERNQQDLLRQLAFNVNVASMMDGRHCDDELVCAFERPLDELFELMVQEGNKRILSVYATSP